MHTLKTSISETEVFGRYTVDEDGCRHDEMIPAWYVQAISEYGRRYSGVFLTKAEAEEAASKLEGVWEPDLGDLPEGIGWDNNVYGSMAYCDDGDEYYAFLEEQHSIY